MENDKKLYFQKCNSTLYCLRNINFLFFLFFYNKLKELEILILLKSYNN